MISMFASTRQNLAHDRSHVPHFPCLWRLLRHPHPIDIVCLASRASGTPPKADPNRRTSAAGGGVTRTTSIAPAPRGSVQSGVNEVAVGDRPRVSVLRDLTESLQIPGEISSDSLWAKYI